ncbi:MAG: RNA 2',3'-cyclic phosphodiesterase [Planctomycetota bacterium]|jgi:2'-5' RNA ligase
MRCFLAIELPTEIRDRLRDLQDRLSVLGRAVRWTRVDNIHLTVKFLGEVPDDQVSAICETATEVAGRFERFEVTVAGTGCFPPGGAARIVWVGMPDPPPILLGCQRVCEDRYARLGFKKENRSFKPHLTVGRVKDFGASAQIRAAVEELKQFNAGSFIVEELVMFQSVLKPQGPVYTPLARASLAGGA